MSKVEGFGQNYFSQLASGTANPGSRFIQWVAVRQAKGVEKHLVLEKFNHEPSEAELDNSDRILYIHPLKPGKYVKQ